MSRADSGPLTIQDLVDLFGIDPQHAADWFTTRKGKGQKQLTQSAWRKVERDCAKLGIAPAEAVQFCAEHETWGFHPDQYRKENRGAPRAPQSFTEAATLAKQRRVAEMTGSAPATEDHYGIIDLH